MNVVYTSCNNYNSIIVVIYQLICSAIVHVPVTDTNYTSTLMD